MASLRTTVGVTVIGAVCATVPGWARSLPQSANALFEVYRAGQHDVALENVRTIRNWARFLEEAERLRDSWGPTTGAVFLLEAAGAGLPPNRDMPFSVSVRLQSMAEELAVRAASRSFLADWYRAAIALQEGRATGFDELPSGWGQVLQPFVERMLMRFPSDPVARMAAARAKESAFFGWLSGGNIYARNPRPTSSWEGRALPAARRLMLACSSQFEALVSLQEVGVEARVRAGFWRLMADDPSGAIKLLQVALGEATAIDDRWHQYLSHFFMGQALAAIDDRPGATRSYRAALEVWPVADSARTPLAAVLLISGARDEAVRTVSTMLTSAARGRDPWVWFPFGDYRFWSERILRLRGQLQ
jgi:hypothetical protein